MQDLINYRQQTTRKLEIAKKSAHFNDEKSLHSANGSLCVFLAIQRELQQQHTNNVNVLKVADQCRIHTRAAACGHARADEEYITDWKIAKSLKLAIDPNFMQLRNTANKQAVCLQKECAFVYGACQHMIRCNAFCY